MIDFLNVTKCFGGKPILNNATFRVNADERVGVVGPNGAGKSTLFSLLTGDMMPDSGTIALPRDVRTGILKQHLPEDETGRPLAEFVADAIPELRQMSAELEAIEEKLNRGDVTDDAMASTLARHGKLQSQIEHLGAYSLKVDAEQALSNLGFAKERFTMPLSSFSGGWRMRAALARTLISRPDLLMLDEPSNYLDIPAVEWLCKFLRSFQGTLLLISHDRFLLRKLTSTTLEVNSGRITRFAGNYDFYRTERENRRRILEAAQHNIDRRKEHLERGIDRFRAKSSKAAQAKSWQKALDRIEDVELPDDLSYHGVIRFPAPPPGGTEALRIEHLTFGYTPEKVLFRDLGLAVLAGEKLAFIGYNGMGKTTLLKLIVGKLKPLSGSVILGKHSVIGYQAQEFADLLVPEQTVYETVRGALPAGASTAGLMNVLGSFGFSGDAAEKPCGVLSGGEKIRLLFARIFVNPPNLLILDEPTTHLDLAARELLQEAIKAYQGTVCLVSHDIEFVRATADGIIAMEPGGIRRYCGNYDYYLEKSAELNGAAATSAAASEDANDRQDLARVRRQQRAQARNAFAAKKKETQQKVSKLEDKMEALEKERAALLEEVGSNGKLDFSTLNRRLTEVQQKITETEAAWEKAANELEEILREIDRINKEM